MVILTSTVSNNSIFTFNKAYADSLGSIRCCVDSSGNVFVADSNNNRIQKFTNTGTYIKNGGKKVRAKANSIFQSVLP
jgi:hypothetical protein